jgi:hypothetical protein
MEPYTIIDTSSVVLAEEPFVYNNVKEKIIYTVNTSKSCEDLTYNIEEFKLFVAEYLSLKNYKFDFNYTMSSCSTPPVSVAANLTLRSPKMDIASNFTIIWNDP